MKVSELKTEMDSRFTAVDERFEQVDKRFEQVDGTLQELRLLIKSEGEATRRHFDVVAEKIVSERNLALDRSMATAEQLVGLIASNAGDPADQCAVRPPARRPRPSTRENRKGPQRRS